MPRKKEHQPVAAEPSRPGRKRKTITPVQRGWVRKWASDGVSDNGIACKLHMDVATFRAILEREPKVRLAYEEGRSQLEHGLVKTLCEQAGRGHIAGAIFLLKSQFGYRDSEAPSVNIDMSDRRTQVVALPAAASTEQYNDLIAHFTKPGNRLPGVIDESELDPIDRTPQDRLPLLKGELGRK